MSSILGISIRAWSIVGTYALVWFILALAFVVLHRYGIRISNDTWMDQTVIVGFWPIGLLCGVVYGLFLTLRWLYHHIHLDRIPPAITHTMDDIVTQLTCHLEEKTDAGELWAGRTHQYEIRGMYSRLVQTIYRELRVKDTTTGRTYRIPVDPDMTTVQQALSWSFGLESPDQYKPVMES